MVFPPVRFREWMCGYNGKWGWINIPFGARVLTMRNFCSLVMKVIFLVGSLMGIPYLRDHTHVSLFHGARVGFVCTSKEGPFFCGFPTEQQTHILFDDPHNRKTGVASSRFPLKLYQKDGKTGSLKTPTHTHLRSEDLAKVHRSVPSTGSRMSMKCRPLVREGHPLYCESRINPEDRGSQGQF